MPPKISRMQYAPTIPTNRSLQLQASHPYRANQRLTAPHGTGGRFTVLFLKNNIIMSAFIPNSIVHYVGKIRHFQEGPGYSVLDTIAHGMPIGNGETNNSGEKIVRCKSLYSGVIFLFKESEIKQ